MERLNRRELLTLQLKEDIGTALLELMREKPFDKITVDDISERANVGRATYYRQFGSKQEALSYWLYHHYLRYEKEHGLSFTGMPIEKYSEAFFEYLLSMKDIHKMLIDSGCGSCIFEAMKPSFPDIDNVSDPKMYYLDYLRLYGLYGMIEGWIKADYDLPPAQISEYACQWIIRNLQGASD